VHYFSPEQAAGENVAETSDIYSVGVVMYEMLTGQVPFDGDSPVAVAMQHLHNKPKPISEISPEVPPAIAHVVMVAMEKEPRYRYQSALEMATDLKKALEGKTDLQDQKSGSQPIPPLNGQGTGPVKIIKSDKSILECEFNAGQLIYGNEATIQLVFKDITESKKDLRRASGVQKHRLAVKFPLREYAKLETIYLPANEVSGDFYQLRKINDKRIIEILGDVAGKGITAALDTTALKVMFHDAVALTHDPVKVLDFLNMEVARHMENDYVAACCFCFDFNQNKLVFAGGGINQLIFNKIGNPLREISMTGTYLGMFEDSRFESSNTSYNIC
jgi:hypothetical protein